MQTFIQITVDPWTTRGGGGAQVVGKGCRPPTQSDIHIENWCINLSRSTADGKYAFVILLIGSFSIIEASLI